MYHFSLTTDLSISTSLRDKRPQALTLTRESTLAWRFVKRAEGRKWLNREVEMDVLPFVSRLVKGRMLAIGRSAWMRLDR